MNRLLLTALALGASACAATAASDDGYKLVWQENFNGDALNTEVWNVEINGDGGGNAELQYYSNGSVKVRDGNLTLTARRKNINGKQFASGRVNTQGKMYFTHGKIEFRVWFPETKNGLWPAVWGLGQDYGEVGWPRCSEMDFVEMGNATGIRNNTQDRYFNGACHWGFYINGNYPNYANAVTAPYSMQDGYHIFTVIWDKNAVKMYYDLDRDPNRQPYYQMNLTDTNGDWGVGNYFHKPIFLVANLAVGGRFTGLLNPSEISALPNVGDERTMYIDWIKIYQNGGEGDTFYSTNGSGDGGDTAVDAIDTDSNDPGYVLDGRTVLFDQPGGAVYTMSGTRISGTDLAPGLYIVKPSGAQPSKIAVR